MNDQAQNDGLVRFGKSSSTGTRKPAPQAPREAATKETTTENGGLCRFTVNSALVK